MKKATQDMVQVSKGGLSYSLSLLQKENNSGIIFNQRVFFLLAENHIGYISKVVMEEPPERVNFEKPKATVMMSDLKSITIAEKTITIKFSLVESNTKIEKVWILRAETLMLARKWYDRLQLEKANHLARISPKREPTHENTLSKIAFSNKKPLEISQEFGIIYTGENYKKEARPKQEKSDVKPKQFRETGTSPKNQQAQVKDKNSQKEFKEAGTAVTPKNSQTSLKLQLVKSSSQQRYVGQDKGNSRFVEGKSNEGRQLSKQDSMTFNQKVARSSSKGPELYPKRNQYVEEEKGQEQGGLIKRSSQLSAVKVEPKRNITISTSLSNRMYFGQEDSELQSNDKLRMYYEMTCIVVKDSKLSESQSHEKKSSDLNTLYDDHNQDHHTDQVLPSSSAKYLKNPNISEKMLRQSTEKAKSISQVGGQNVIEEVEEEERATNSGGQDRLPWTYKFISRNELVFQQFAAFAEGLLWQLIGELQLPDNRKKNVPKLVKKGIYYYQIGDVEVKLAVMGLEDICLDQGKPLAERICSKTAIKCLQNQFQNYHTLYRYLHNNQKLRVPLVSLCEVWGFVALFKATSRQQTGSIKASSVQRQLQSLKAVSGIEHSFNENIKKLVIHLDEQYYNSFRSSKDHSLDFNCYVIQQLNAYLLPDLLSGEVDKLHLLLRRELIEKYREEVLLLQEISSESRSGGRSSREVKKFGRNVIKSISDIIPDLDSLKVYFLNPNELAAYLHTAGINLRYMGAIYDNLKSPFPRKYIMTEMAARSCKSLLRKTMQDISLQQGPSDKRNFLAKVSDFLNCVLGNTYQTAAIWKVLSMHNQSYFGVELNFDQIHKGHFVISLIQNCNLMVAWERIRPEQAFKSNMFFSERNFIGLRTAHKHYDPVYSEVYQKIADILTAQEQIERFDEIKTIIQLQQPLPYHLHCLQDRLKRYVTYFVSPDKANEIEGLNLFENQDRKCPSRVWIDLQLMEIKWYLKLRRRERYIRCCDDFIKNASRYFGQFHVIFSQLYDLFSAYHLANSEYEDAITFAKSSLVNVLKICGTNNEKTSECYYHLALCYIKVGRSQEAISHIKKAKQHFETSNKIATIPYALMSLKLALLHLNQHQVEECIKANEDTLRILESQAQGYENEITESYDMLARCYQLLHQPPEMRQLSQHCYQKLPSIKNPLNFEKMLKIYLYPVLSRLPPQDASSYLGIVSLLQVEANSQNYSTSYELLKGRVLEGGFSRLMDNYFLKLSSIERQISEHNMLASWKGLTQVYQRETINDFISFTEELLLFVGEGYLTGSLRQAL